MVVDSVNPDQTALCVHHLLRPICLSTLVLCQ